MVNRDFSDLFAALNDADVRYLLVGAHARGLAFPGCVLTTSLDIGGSQGFGGSVSGTQGALGTAVGAWWADLDALEVQAPGTFIGVPVVLKLNVSLQSGGCPTTCIALAAQMVKK